jgi:hypothetical protein
MHWEESGLKTEPLHLSRFMYGGLQKHDRETLAELAVAKKEVEALKVTVTLMEERETKGSQQLGKFEGRVTELDQKLWEAMQSEVKGNIDLFCASLVHPLS